MWHPLSAVIVTWLAVAHLATAAPAEAIKVLEGKLALDRAKALAGKSRPERAQALCERLKKTHPDLADLAEKLAADIATRAGKDGAQAGPKEYADARDKAKKTGRPMMLFFGRDACGLCKYTKANLEHSRLATYRQRMIEAFMDIDAPANRPLLSRLREGKQMRMLPFMFYVSPSEEVLDHSSGGQDIEKLQEKFRAVLRKSGPPADPKRMARALKALRRANAQMDAGTCGATLRTYRGLAKFTLNKDIAQEANDCLEIIEQQADGLLAEAKQAIAAGRYAEAVPPLVVLRRDFAGTRATQAVGALALKLAADPRARAHLGALASGITQRAAGPPPTREPEPKDAPTATPKPKPEHKPPAANAARANSLLRMAKNYIANSRPDKAKPLLETIVAKHPDTAAAIEARELLQ